jgi:crossover junction endodeoxyribonuclease RuvC
VTLYLGIDPGASGAAAFICERGNVVSIIEYKKFTTTEIAASMKAIAASTVSLVACIEKVHSMPGQGVRSVFSFGENFGWWHGLLAGLGIPLAASPSPQRWQKDMGCLSKGDKNVTKAAAHRLWPKDVKALTHGTADACLLGEWLRRERRNLDAASTAYADGLSAADEAEALREVPKP